MKQRLLFRIAVITIALSAMPLLNAQNLTPAEVQGIAEKPISTAIHSFCLRRRGRRCRQTA
jgi:hypothetical protein